MRNEQLYVTKEESSVSTKIKPGIPTLPAELTPTGWRVQCD